MDFNEDITFCGFMGKFLICTPVASRIALLNAAKGGTIFASPTPLARVRSGEREFKVTSSSVNATGFRGSSAVSFAEAIYKYGANEYHETYLSWKSIIWLQNILEKKKRKLF